MSEYTDDDRQNEQAMVLLGVHGSQSSLDDAWEGYAFHNEGAPECWLSDDETIDRDHCHAVLHCGFSDPKHVPGFRVAFSYTCGERECPWCGPGTGDDDEGRSPEQRQPNCKLCEGDGLIYWGEDWSVIVYAPIDPDATLKEIRQLVADRDETGQMWDDQHGRKLASLVADLDAHLTGGYNELPLPWNT